MALKDELKNKSIKEIRNSLLNKDFSAKELLDSQYQRIDDVENQVQSYNSLTKDIAYETAKKVDEKIQKGEELPMLAGIPIAVKDNMCVENTFTTASSKILENFKAPYNATVVEKLNESLCPIVGKANLDEFAMGSSTENSATKITKNPWDLNKVPGGSSGGSAASVAASEAIISLGSDTGGSIRLPASFCGIVGMKPTYGTVSRYGLLAFASSLDQIGPFGKTVEDVAYTLQAISGHDKKDSTSLPNSVPDFTENLKKDFSEMKIGVISEIMGDGLQPEVKKSMEDSIKKLQELGATIEEISMPHTKYAIATYYIIATAEASSNLARYDGVRYGYRTENSDSLLEMYTKTRSEAFGDEVKRRIMIGTYALSSGYYDAYYKKAQQLRRLITEDFNKAFENVDFLICPTCPNTAFEIGAKTSDPLSMYLTDIATITANMAGIPGLSLPCGLDKGGMPIGLQILGPILSEVAMLNLAYKLEEAIGFNAVAKL